MIKIKLNEFWQKYKERISKAGIIIVVFVVIILSLRMFFASMSRKAVSNDTAPSSYKPESTVISGSDVTPKKQEENFNRIDEFMNYCNAKDINSAYNMLTDECKQSTYKTIEEFNKKFYKEVFAKNRKYNIQAWATNYKYVVYKLRITDDILATGNYNSSAKYETYITTYLKENTDKVSIGEYVYTEDINKQTNTNLLQATAIKKNIYVKEEEYEIKVKNLSDKTILLYDLKNKNSINLYGSNGNPYLPYYDKLSNINFRIDYGETITIKLKFNKSIGSDNKSKEIRFDKIITDYEQYKILGDKYDEKLEKINIKL